MKKLQRLGYLTVILFVFSLTSIAQTYTFQTDKFSVWFPSTPNIEDSLSASGLNVRAYISNDGNTVAKVSVINLHKIKYTAKLKSEIYNGIRDVVLTDFGAKLLSEKEIILSGERGKDYKYTLNIVPSGNVIYYQRLLIKGYKLYQIHFVSSQTNLYKKFLESFRFLRKNDNTAKVSKNSFNDRWGDSKSKHIIPSEQIPPSPGRGIGRGSDKETEINQPSPKIESTEVKPKETEVINGETSPLKILRKPRANYTEEAKKNGTQGTITLKVTFRSDGTIGNISVVKGLPDGLNQLAIDAARKIIFEPERMNGIAVTVTKQVTYNFTIY